MPIKPDREYRNLGNFELDFAEEDIVTGYASTFETYELYKDGDLTFYERIDPRAFEGADLNDVVFLRDHTGRVLARTKNGSVQLWTDDHGLAQKTNLGLTEASRAMLEDIRVGNYSQMSFSFVVARDHIDWIDDTKAVRVIDSIGKVYDVSAVAFPANPYTEIGLSARSLFDGAIEERTAERLAAAKRERARKALQLKVQILKGGTHGN
jgi:HK97 family phage prohead protease